MPTAHRNAATLPMGRAIAAARMELRWTQRELGERVGVSEKTISRWELGEVDPRAGDRPRVVEALASATPRAIADLRAAFGLPAPRAAQPKSAADAPSRFALEAALFTFAETTDCSPRAVRAGAFAFLSHLELAGLRLEDARAMLAGHARDRRE